MKNKDKKIKELEGQRDFFYKWARMLLYVTAITLVVFVGFVFAIL